MNYSEVPLTFQVAGDQVLGIVALPEKQHDLGVLIAVGGPQYRIGSHRQFLLLARRLASEGFPVLRFDYRGMGDSEGAVRGFEDVSEDIGAAIDAFQQCFPEVRRFVLWGLCDAASAILMYLQVRRDSRVEGVALFNPWVRSEASLAQTHIKHYYGQRLLQRDFWRKLLGGKMDFLGSLRELLGNAKKARSHASGNAGRALSFQDQMLEGLRQLCGNVLLVLSGQDYTAREFLEYTENDGGWSGLLAARNVCRIDIPEADHTFSSAALRSRVEDETLKWLRGLRAILETR